MKKHRGKMWYRVKFLDGTFFYLPFDLTFVKKLVGLLRKHGKITHIRKMENRL